MFAACGGASATVDSLGLLVDSALIVRRLADRPGATGDAWSGGDGKTDRHRRAWALRITLMPLRIQCVCVDTADPARLASFWQSALGWRRTFEQDGQVVLEPPEGSAEDGVAPDLLFLRVPEGKAGKNRLHLDLRPRGPGRRGRAAGGTRREPG